MSSSGDEQLNPQWTPEDVYDTSMNADLISLIQVGPVTTGVFNNAGYNTVGDVWRAMRNDERAVFAALWTALDDMAEQNGTGGDQRWSSLHARCVTVARRLCSAQAATFPPEVMCCPLTHTWLCDPVITPDGITYERRPLVAWVRQHGSEPTTLVPLREDQLVDNRSLRDFITEFQNRFVAVQVPLYPLMHQINGRST